MLVFFCQAVLFVYCVIFFISEAVLADSVKIDPVVIDSPVTAGWCDVQDRINIVHFQIVNMLAFCADEMMVPHRIRIEVICSVYRLDLYDLTELGQKRPEGIERSTYFWPSNSRVCPAFGPPWKRATTSDFFPAPKVQSTHCFSGKYAVFPQSGHFFCQ